MFIELLKKYKNNQYLKIQKTCTNEYIIDRLYQLLENIVRYNFVFI